MPQSAIEAWTKHTRIANLWGSTESITACHLEGPNEDAAYNFLDVDNSSVEFRKVTTDEHEGEMYEMVFSMKRENALTASWHALQGINPGGGLPLEEWNVGDLWSPHPDPVKARYAWKFVGRRDDLVQFSSGLNLHPGPLERALSSQKNISGGLLLGTGHQQSILLLEPHTDGFGSDGVDQLFESVIEDCNVKMGRHGRVARSHVLVVPVGGFVRAPKGTVMRKKTEEKFRGEIETVYKEHGDVAQSKFDR